MEEMPVDRTSDLRNFKKTGVNNPVEMDTSPLGAAVGEKCTVLVVPLSSMTIVSFVLSDLNTEI